MTEDVVLGGMALIFGPRPAREKFAIVLKACVAQFLAYGDASEKKPCGESVRPYAFTRCALQATTTVRDDFADLH